MKAQRASKRLLPAEFSEIYCERISYTTRQGITIHTPCLDLFLPRAGLRPRRDRPRFLRMRPTNRVLYGFSRRLLFIGSRTCTRYTPMKNLLPIYPTSNPSITLRRCFRRGSSFIPRMISSRRKPSNLDLSYATGVCFAASPAVYDIAYFAILNSTICKT